MKVRGDFVTNSSSVSYILTMNEEMFDINIEQFDRAGFVSFLKYLKEKIKNEGEKVNIEDKELYALKIEFNDDYVISLEDYTKDSLWNDFDFDQLPDEEKELLLYYLILNKTYLLSIGATQVETY